MSDQDVSRQPDPNDNADTITDGSDAGVGPETLRGIRLLREHINSGETTHAEVMEAISREETKAASTEDSSSRALSSVRYFLRPMTLPDGREAQAWWPIQEKDVPWYDRQSTQSIAGFEFLSKVLDPSNPLISGVLASTSLPELNVLTFAMWSIMFKKTAERGSDAINVVPPSEASTPMSNASNDTDEAKGEANGEPST
ncbi:hypothetical protein JCM24511_07954 [Saitozyma sp. JCM 24511]|nr:hypothetical protein JCM24511_07954 [Saitozyma sp. JCM 24511]